MKVLKGLMSVCFAAVLCGCSLWFSVVELTPCDYAVVMKKNTFSDQVVSTLSNKYPHLRVQCFEYESDVEEVLGDLQAHHPRWTCFAVPLQEAGRDFTVRVSRMCRALDDEPYVDTYWGILTGAAESDVLRIAALEEPLAVRNLLDAAGTFDLSVLPEGTSFSESNRGVIREKRPGQPVHEVRDSTDNTARMVQLLCDSNVDGIITSAHASERNWEMGYHGPNMVMFNRGDNLFARDTKGKEFPLVNAHPKIWIAAGNCLIGNVPENDSDCMTSAMLHALGVYQFMGYTVPTWFGAQGWGTLNRFADFNGLYSFNEAFHFANTCIVENLQKNNGRYADVNLPNYDINFIFNTYRPANADSSYSQEVLGNLFDRDVVAFYGDPAWRAVLSAENGPKINVRQTSDTGEANRPLTHFQITLMQDCSFSDEGLFVPCEKLLFGPELQNLSANLKAVHMLATENFIHLYLKGDYPAGTVFSFTVEARKDRETVNADLAARGESLFRSLPGSYSRSVAQLNADFKQACARMSTADRYAFLAALNSPRPPQENAYLAQVIAMMPRADLKALNFARLRDNVAFALKVRREAPWKAEINEDLFVRYILPYWTLDEARDPWRKMLYERFFSQIRHCKTLHEAYYTLNKNDNVFKTLGVSYHKTKRPKPNQSLKESLEASYASCTGLSVILLEACRACGIPARFVGCPVWCDYSGNHNWIEFWDGSAWVYEGASESDPRDRNWVGDKVNAFTSETEPLHKVWAITPVPQSDGNHFRIVWDAFNTDYPAVPIQMFYKEKKMEQTVISFADDSFSGVNVIWVYYRGEPFARILPQSGDNTLQIPQCVLDDCVYYEEDEPEAHPLRNAPFAR